MSAKLHEAKGGLNMKYYSETLNKFYESEKDCTEAEKAYKEELEAKKAKEKELAEGRKARAKEVEEAYKAALEAQKKYNSLVKDFCHDYGSFHMTLTEPFDLFDWLRI